MKKRSRRLTAVLAMLMAVAILWSNSLGAYAYECPSPYSPTGYHDYNRHNFRGGEFTVSSDHDVYTGTLNGMPYYETCYVTKTETWCVISCAFCGREDPTHYHVLGESHSINHRR